MKKNISFKKLSMILASGFLFAVTSCTFATRANLKEMTEEAEVIGTNIEDYKQYKKNGVYLIPSNISNDGFDGFTLKLYISNPQNFNFTCSDIKYYFGDDADGVTVTPSEKEHNTITINYTKTYLEKMELKYIEENEDVPIQPGHLTDPDPSYVLFTEFNNKDNKNKKEIKYTCPYIIECDSVPDSIKSPKTFYTKTSGDDSISNSVLLFNMPVSSNSFTSDKNGDIKTLVLSAINTETNKTIHTYKYNLSVVEDSNNAGNYYFKFELNNSTSDDIELISAYEFQTINGLKPTDRLASYTDDDEANWSLDKTVLFFSTDDSSQGQVEYLVKLIDKKDQESESIGAHTQEFPQLPSEVSIYNNDNQLNSGDSIKQDEDSYTASISFAIPDTIYYLGVRGESGAIEARTTYYDTDADQSFKLTVNESYAQTHNEPDSSLLSINEKTKSPDKVKENFEKWLEEHKIEIISENMPEEAKIYYNIKDSNKTYGYGTVAPGYKISLPPAPGGVTITTNIECPSAENSNFKIYMDSDTSKPSTITVSANKLYVKDHTHTAGELDYGTTDRPYYSITAAANALSDPSDETNAIDVIGKLTENISFSSGSATENNKYKVTLNAIKDNNVTLPDDPYPIITAKDSDTPVLTIGNNYVVTINNFTFIGDISIGENSEVIFIDCKIGDDTDVKYTGKIEIGANSTVTFSKGTVTSRNTIISDITCDEASTLKIETGTVTGDITAEAGTSITICAGSTVMGNIISGDNSSISICNASGVTGNITSGDYSLITVTAYEDAADTSGTTSESAVIGNITAGNGKNQDDVLKIIGSYIYGNITIKEDSTALIEDSAISAGYDVEDSSESGNVYVGINPESKTDYKNPSVLKLNGSVAISGKVILANPSLNTDGTAKAFNYIKLEAGYKPSDSRQIKIYMSQPTTTATGYLPVIDFDDVWKGSYNNSKDIRNDVTGSTFKYFISVLSGFNLWIEGSESSTITLKPSGVQIVKPVTDGFEVNGIADTYTAGNTINVTITNSKINGAFSVETPKMELFLMGQRVINSDSFELPLYYNKNPIPAGTYQLVVSFVYNGMTFSYDFTISIID